MKYKYCSEYNLYYVIKPYVSKHHFNKQNLQNKIFFFVILERSFLACRLVKSGADALYALLLGPVPLMFYI